jgi:hypothetical protein
MSEEQLLRAMMEAQGRSKRPVRPAGREVTAPR